MRGGAVRRFDATLGKRRGLGVPDCNALPAVDRVHMRDPEGGKNNWESEFVPAVSKEKLPAKSAKMTDFPGFSG